MGTADRFLLSKVASASVGLTLASSHKVGNATLVYGYLCRKMDKYNEDSTYGSEEEKEIIQKRIDKYIRQFNVLVYGKNPEWWKVK